MMPNSLQRYHETIAAVCPIHGVAADHSIDYKPEATASELAAAATAAAAFDWSEPAQMAWENVEQRTAASAQVTDTNTAGKVLRGIVTVLVDEINVLRQWIVAFKAEVAAAASLADLKTRVAAIPGGMADRTLVQAKTAIQDAINNGTAD